jgi:tight adherence protein C
MFTNPDGPTLLGFNVIFIGTLLIGVTALAVMLAVYAAVTVRDPMAKRVKALNDRREQLKAGIVISNAKKRQSMTARFPSSSRSSLRRASARKNWPSRSSSRAWCCRLCSG